MTIPSTPAGASLATDTRSIGQLRASAAREPKTAIKEAAKQFEALFMQQLMKSMREATLSSGMLDNEGSKLGTEMLDNHLSTQMTGLPGGLADAIARQLERQMGGGAEPAAARSTDTPAASPPAATEGKVSQVQTDFLHKHLNAALAAQAQTGIPATFMVAQAAHETG